MKNTFKNDAQKMMRGIEQYINEEVTVVFEDFYGEPFTKTAVLRDIKPFERIYLENADNKNDNGGYPFFGKVQSIREIFVEDNGAENVLYYCHLLPEHYAGTKYERICEIEHEFFGDAVNHYHTSALQVSKAEPQSEAILF